MALASTCLILGLAAMGQARAATVLTAASVQKLVVAEDSANFLAQVALMAGQVPQVSGLTSDQQSGLIQGSWSDVQTAAAALANVQVVAGAAGTNAAVAQRLKKAVNVLTADITKLGKAVTANPLSAATQKALQTMGQDAAALVKEIQRDYAMLPPTQRPVELTLAPAAGQARVFSANATVKFVLSGPKVAITGGNETWTVGTGSTDKADLPLVTPLTVSAASGTSGSARVTVKTTATEFGAWTYVYYQYGVRRPTLLLLNLGPPASSGGNTTGGNTTDGGNTYTGGTSINSGTLSLGSGSGGNLSTGSSGNLSIGTSTIEGSSILAGGTLTIVDGDNLNTGSSGNLTINGTNTYAGGAFISSGASASLSNSGNSTTGVTLNVGGTLVLNTGASDEITLGSGGSYDLFTYNSSSAFTGVNTGSIYTLIDFGSTMTTINTSIPPTFAGNTTINSGTLTDNNASLPSGNIVVQGAGTLEFQPDANDSLTVSAVATAGSAYPWGNTTYEVDVQADGSWALPALGVQILAVTGGYEIVPWVAPGS
jgi:hypothetical protein